MSDSPYVSHFITANVSRMSVQSPHSAAASLAITRYCARMQLRLRHRIRSVTSSFWFIPTLLTIVALIAAGAMLHLDQQIAISQWAKQNPVLSTSAEGARNLLATIAGSAISVAGVVFSITIVVLNMAAAQFGPSLISNFMHHRGTQVVLGAFVSTFTYCLVVLRFVDDESQFVPHIAANFGFLLGLTSFFLLIYFIHHVSVFIQAERVIDDVAGKMERVLRASFPERRAKEKTPDDEQNDETERQFDDSAHVIARCGGYLQVADVQRLLAVAVRHDICIALHYRPGHFVIKGAKFANVIPAAKMNDAIADAVHQCLALGPQRSETQDPEFAVYQLVEIALRALSTGINDPFTALNCIDHLGAALALLAERELPSRYVRDEHRRVRVVRNPLTYAGIVEAEFDQIRQTAQGNAAVIFRLLNTLTELGHRNLPDAFRNALIKQLHAIRAQNRESFDNKVDQEAYEARLTAAEKTLSV